MRSFLYSLAVAILVGVGQMPANAAAAEAPAAPLRGQWTRIVPLRAGVFSLAMGNQIMGAPSETGRPEDSSFLLRSLDRISPPILRLPGGDLLNTWSYVAGRNLKNPATGNEKLMHAGDYLKIAAAAHAQPLWGVNVTTVDASETEALAQSLQQVHPDTSLFELGNELYLPQWADQTKTAGIYAEKAAPHAAVLRKYFPHAKLGVPLASYWMLAPLRPENATAFAWKKPAELPAWIQDMAKRTDFYDAVVLHLYLVPNELGKTGLATHTADEVVRWAWVRSDARQVQDLFGLVHGVFPTKDIWVTEWAFNATQYINANRQDTRYQVHQTMLAVLYNARFMLNTAYYVPYVPIMTLWTLYGQAPVDLLRGSKTGINFELFRMLRWARENNDGLARLELPGAPMLKGPAGPQAFDQLESPACDAFGFYHGDQLQSVMILNVSSQPAAVEIPGFAGAKKIYGHALSSPEMLPDWGNPKNPAPTAWTPPYGYQTLELHNKVATVPANSLSVFRAGEDLP